MSSSSDGADSALSNVFSLLENLSQIRMLLLLLSLCLYSDVWLVEYDINPNRITISSCLYSIQTMPILTIVVFLVLYSALIGVIFPFFRQIIRDLIIFNRKVSNPTKVEKNATLIADMSFSIIIFSALDIILGLLTQKKAYTGICLFVIHVMQSSDFIHSAFRVSFVFCLVACIARAFTTDA